MYKLLNKLFGWDYVYVEYGLGHTLCRVMVFASVPYIKVYGSIVLLKECVKTGDRRIIWSTCDPSKYGCGYSVVED